MEHLAFTRAALLIALVAAGAASADERDQQTLLPIDIADKLQVQIDAEMARRLEPIPTSTRPEQVNAELKQRHLSEYLPFDAHLVVGKN